MSQTLQPAPEGQITILYVDVQGEGYATPTTIPAGTTISTFFTQRLGGNVAPNGYQKRVRRGSELLGGNENPLTADFALQHGDAVSFTPLKMDMGG